MGARHWLLLSGVTPSDPPLPERAVCSVHVGGAADFLILARDAAANRTRASQMRFNQLISFTADGKPRTPCLPPPGANPAAKFAGLWILGSLSISIYLSIYLSMNLSIYVTN